VDQEAHSAELLPTKLAIIGSMPIIAIITPKTTPPARPPITPPLTFWFIPLWVRATVAIVVLLFRGSCPTLLAR